ncbi:hypothetical protein KEM48_006164 [Puccinia striiformis f. sp. tritici PST-130]|nr:hypothetical protein KEM48_006164 [Puccinia striiformis f. sp. tritici PST-130]
MSFLGLSLVTWQTLLTPSQAKSKGIDHLYFILSRLIFQYGCLLFGIGVLTTGASQANMKRKIWRTRLTLTSILCLVIEGLNSLGVHLDGLVNRLRLTALQRTTIMKDLHYRTQLRQTLDQNHQRQNGTWQHYTTTLSDQIQKEEQDDGEDGKHVKCRIIRLETNFEIGSIPFPDPSFDDSTTTPISL